MKKSAETEKQLKDSENTRFLVSIRKDDLEKLKQIANAEMRPTATQAGFILHQYITGRLIEKPSDKL